MSPTQPPAPAILGIDGYVWERALASDADILDELAAEGSNRALFGLPRTSEAFAAALSSKTITRPMVCRRGAEAIGAAAGANRNQRSLNIQLLCWFRRPGEAVAPLAAYVRHIFWTLPMHRVYAQLPVIPGADEYRDLLRAAGFSEEGVVRGHGLFAGQPCDVAALGLLRREFEAWCQTNETRLAL